MAPTHHQSGQIRQLAPTSRRYAAFRQPACASRLGCRHDGPSGAAEPVEREVDEVQRHALGHARRARRADHTRKDLGSALRHLERIDKRVQARDDLARSRESPPVLCGPGSRPRRRRPRRPTRRASANLFVHRSGTSDWRQEDHLRAIRRITARNGSKNFPLSSSMLSKYTISIRVASAHPSLRPAKVDRAGTAGSVTVFGRPGWQAPRALRTPPVRSGGPEVALPGRDFGDYHCKFCR